MRLREAPVIAYDGDVPGYRATRPAKGKKIDRKRRRRLVRRYLKGKHDAVLASRGGGRKLHS